MFWLGGGAGTGAFDTAPLSGVAKTVPGDEDKNNEGFHGINHYSSRESTRTKHTTSKNYLKFLLLPKRSHYSCPKSVRPIFLKISYLVCIRLCGIWSFEKTAFLTKSSLFEPLFRQLVLGMAKKKEISITLKGHNFLLIGCS